VGLPLDWAGALAESLIDRQKPDGSWANDVDVMGEDSAVIATCFALDTLEICRENLPEGKEQ